MGAESIGPFASREKATQAAEEMGQSIVRADIANPELD
ncbi:DUF6723 family protein [Burkholderia sp. Leaf177]